MSTRDDHPQGTLRETAPAYSMSEEGDNGVDLGLLRISLAMTPWERMKANDDALNFAESLRAAMTKRNATPL